MDTPTQALLGAVVGQAFFSGKLGRRAMVWGAVAGAIPDLDILATAFLGPWGEVLYHRGPTHALWFSIAAGPLCGYAVWKGYARRSGREAETQTDAKGGVEGHRIPDPGDPTALRSWIGLFVLALLTHPLLDIFTSYGTQLFTPFSNHRVALNGIGIIDPVYSLILVLSLALGFLLHGPGRFVRSRRAAFVALLFSTSYLFYGLWLNTQAEKMVRLDLEREGFEDVRVRCYPTILQPYLRRVVGRSDREVLVGTISMWNPGPVRWQRFTMLEHPLIQKVLGTWEGRIFNWFSMGQTAPHVRTLTDGFQVEIDDIRYGYFGPPDHGLWGIRARFDLEGRLLGAVQRFSRPYPDPREALGRLWREAFGPPRETVPGAIRTKAGGTGPQAGRHLNETPRVDQQMPGPS